MNELHRPKGSRPARRAPCPPGGPGLAFCSLAGGDAVSVAAARLRAVGISGSPAATSKSRTLVAYALAQLEAGGAAARLVDLATLPARSEEHTSELQSQSNLVCRLLLEK